MLVRKMINKTIINMNKNNTNLPQFISNKACGEDKTEGSAQKFLVEAIAKHIDSTDANNNEQNISRIIGLKGEWGTGKTNVIKQLEKNELIKDKYHIFEYDAWGHQEDLQRRSFLETLTTDLINGKSLSGETKIRKKNGQEDTITWEEKLKYLLASKREIETEKRPKLNDNFIWSIIVLILTPIFAIIANVASNNYCCPFWLPILIVTLPLLCLFVYFLIKRFKQKLTCKKIFQEIVSIYSGKIENAVSYETISKEEPSVIEFKEWMEDISDHLGKSGKNKKLIIVYDNMDRLPADKVKELWSSIHTFFSENSFRNIWVLIPFDETHLSCAFGENEKLTKHFISKTFPIVYRVTPPVITDFKGLFDKLFEEAFGTTEPQETQNTISRIFRIEKPNATIREIIEFINQLVTLKRIWGNEIDLLHSAVFAIKEKEILKDPVKQILSGDYLGNNLKYIVVNNEELQTNISTLVYGVSKKYAKQIPMKKYIESCFDNEAYDINKHSQSPLFIPILQSSIQDTDKVKIDSIIAALSKLKVDSFEDKDKLTITSLWDELAKKKEKHDDDDDFIEQKFDDSHKALLLNISDKNSFVERMCHRIQGFTTSANSPNIEFSGINYYNSLKTIEECVEENNLSIDISKYLEEKEIDVGKFVEYMKEAKNDYNKFKIFTNNSELNNYFLKKDNEKIKDLSILEYLKQDKRYKFETLKRIIEEFISSANLNHNNFKQIFDAYKIICNDKPLNKQLTPIQREQIWKVLSTKNNTDEYLEIAAMRLANNENISIDLSKADIQYIANQMDYYADYGQLLVASEYDNSSLNDVLKYMTENELGYKLSLNDVLPQFLEITRKVNVKESILLKKLNSCEEDKKSITKNNIQTIIQDADFFIHSIETKNSLTDCLNKTVIEALEDIDEDTLYSDLQKSNRYWYKVVDNFIDTDFCKPLPSNIFNLGIRYLTEVATNGNIPQKNEVTNKIIFKLDKRKTGSTIIEIRNKFCNSESTINKDKFLYLESWLFKQGELQNRATEVVHRIIYPIIDDEDCLNLIVNNFEFYAEIINAASDIDATKEIIQEKVNSSEDSKLIEFAKKIGINKP